jgi:hypothetical protein
VMTTTGVVQGTLEKVLKSPPDRRQVRLLRSRREAISMMLRAVPMLWISQQHQAKVGLEIL